MYEAMCTLNDTHARPHINILKPPWSSTTAMNYSPTVFAAKQPHDSYSEDKFTQMFGELRHLNEIEQEERRMLTTKMDELKVQLGLCRMNSGSGDKLEEKVKGYKNMLRTLSSESDKLREANERLREENSKLKNGLVSSLNKLNELAAENKQLRAASGAQSQVIGPQQIRLHRNRDLPPSPKTTKPATFEVPETKTMISVRIVGKRSMLKQCGFRFSLSNEDLQDTSFLLEKCCTKYCEKFGLNPGDLVFTNYKGDQLDVSQGYQVENGDIVYVNYK